MSSAQFDYVRLGEEALALAQASDCLAERQEHLFRAVRYGSLARLTGQASPSSNVVELRPATG